VLPARIRLSLARNISDLSYAARHAEAGLALAERLGDPGLTGEALVQKLAADFWTGRGLSIALGDRAMDLEREARSARVEDRAAMALGWCLQVADRFDEARHWFEETLRAAREEGDGTSRPTVLGHLAEL